MPPKNREKGKGGKAKKKTNPVPDEEQPSAEEVETQDHEPGTLEDEDESPALPRGPYGWREASLREPCVVLALPAGCDTHRKAIVRGQLGRRTAGVRLP